MNNCIQRAPQRRVDYRDFVAILAIYLLFSIWLSQLIPEEARLAYVVFTSSYFVAAFLTATPYYKFAAADPAIYFATILYFRLAAEPDPLSRAISLFFSGLMLFFPYAWACYFAGLRPGLRGLLRFWAVAGSAAFFHGLLAGPGPSLALNILLAALFHAYLTTQKAYLLPWISAGLAAAARGGDLAEIAATALPYLTTATYISARSGLLASKAPLGKKSIVIANLGASQRRQPMGAATE